MIGRLALLVFPKLLVIKRRIRSLVRQIVIAKSGANI